MSTFPHHELPAGRRLCEAHGFTRGTDPEEAMAQLVEVVARGGDCPIRLVTLCGVNELSSLLGRTPVYFNRIDDADRVVPAPVASGNPPFAGNKTGVRRANPIHWVEAWLVAENDLPGTRGRGFQTWYDAGTRGTTRLGIIIAEHGL